TGGERAAIATAAGVRRWKRATSLGSVESLIEHRASVEGAGSPAPPDLLRLPVGRPPRRPRSHARRVACQRRQPLSQLWQTYRIRLQHAAEGPKIIRVLLTI